DVKAPVAYVMAKLHNFYATRSKNELKELVEFLDADMLAKLRRKEELSSTDIGQIVSKMTAKATFWWLKSQVELTGAELEGICRQFSDPIQRQKIIDKELKVRHEQFARRTDEATLRALLDLEDWSDGEAVGKVAEMASKANFIKTAKAVLKLILSIATIVAFVCFAPAFSIFALAGIALLAHHALIASSIFCTAAILRLILDLECVGKKFGNAVWALRCRILGEENITGLPKEHRGSYDPTYAACDAP
ncbi:MAG: hypothetical protein RL235_928, partial [Chlamydiota bacterium]